VGYFCQENYSLRTLWFVLSGAICQAGFGVNYYNLLSRFGKAAGLMSSSPVAHSFERQKNDRQIWAE
jgi:hypothetical protein